MVHISRITIWLIFGVCLFCCFLSIVPYNSRSVLIITQVLVLLSIQDYSWMSINCKLSKLQNRVGSILGGSHSFHIKHTDFYNILRNRCSRPGPPTPRENMSACVFEGKIFTSGGSEAGMHGDMCIS